MATLEDVFKYRYMVQMHLAPWRRRETTFLVEDGGDDQEECGPAAPDGPPEPSTQDTNTPRDKP